MKGAINYIIILFFYVASNQCLAQNNIDSLENLLETQNRDMGKANVLLKLVKAAELNDTAKQSDYFYQLNQLAKFSNNDSVKAYCYFGMGEYYYRDNQFSKSMNHFSASYDLYTALGDNYKTTEILGKIGRMYYGQGDYVEALELYLDALKIHEDHQIKNDKLGWLLRYIGSVFKRQGNYEAALNYYNKSLLVFEDLNNSDGIASCYNNLGIVYGLQGDVDKELDYFKKALKISRKDPNSSRIPVILANIGQKLQMKGNYKEALRHYNEAFELYKKERRYSFMASSIAVIGNVYYEQGKYQLAIRQFNEAEYYAFQSDKKRAIRLEYIYSNLSWIYDSINDPKKALKYYKLHEGIKDSLADKESVTKIAELHAKFEADKEKQKMERLSLEKKVLDQELSLSKQNEKITLFRIFLIVGFSLAIIITLVITTIRRVKTQKRKVEINNLRRKMAILEKDQLEKQLKFKNRDLTNFALDITRKQEFTEEVLGRLKGLKLTERSSEIKTLIQFVTGQRDIDKNLNFLYENVELVNSEFFNKLLEVYPELTKNEKLLCGLIRINLSNKEICSIRNITPKAVKMGKYRLKKSLGIPPEESLDVFLQEF